jgi:hypothetical protein
MEHLSEHSEITEPKQVHPLVQPPVGRPTAGITRVSNVHLRRDCNRATVQRMAVRAQ